MKHEQVPADSPDRCQGVAPATGSQCSNRATLDGRCDACRAVDPVEREHTDWLTQQYKKAVRSKINPGAEIDLLREDVLTIRALIAARRDMIEDSDTFREHSGHLSTLMTKAEKLIRTLVELERQNDQLLNKDALLVWATSIHKIVLDKIEGRFEGWEDVGDELGTLLAESIVHVKNPE